jgi:hypothetical protein
MVPAKLRFGVLLTALAISSGGIAWAANGGPQDRAQPQKSAALRFALPAAHMMPLAPGPLAPYRPVASRSLSAWQPLAGFFNTRFNDPLRRAEACENIPKIRPPDYYSLHSQPYGFLPFTGDRIPYRSQAGFNGMNNAESPGNESVNLYFLCLQNSSW